jgi:hypothetical protein
MALLGSHPGRRRGPLSGVDLPPEGRELRNIDAQSALKPGSLTTLPYSIPDWVTGG